MEKISISPILMNSAKYAAAATVTTIRVAVLGNRNAANTTRVFLPAPRLLESVTRKISALQLIFARVLGVGFVPRRRCIPRAQKARAVLMIVSLFGPACMKEEIANSMKSVAVECVARMGLARHGRLAERLVKLVSEFILCWCRKLISSNYRTSWRCFRCHL